MKQTRNVSLSLRPASVEKLDKMAAAARASRSWMLERLLEAAIDGATIQVSVTKPAPRSPNLPKAA